MTRKTVLDYNTLEKVKSFLEKKLTPYKYTIQFDEWEGFSYEQLRNKTITQNQCLVIKKNAFIGAKITFVELNVIDIQPIAPSSYANNLTQKGVLALLINLFIGGAQNTVVNSTEQLILEIQN